MKALILALLTLTQTLNLPPGYRDLSGETVLRICGSIPASETWARRFDAAEAGDPVRVPGGCRQITTSPTGPPLYGRQVHDFTIGFRGFGVFEIVSPTRNGWSFRGFAYFQLGTSV